MTTKQRQCLLAYLGYYTGELDDIYGSGTRTAVTAFQEAAGIGVDGVAGAQTDEALIRAVAEGKPMAQKSTPAANRPTTGTYWDKIRYFRRSDAFIGCSCGKCGGFPAEPTERLMLAADAVREHFGAPVIPTSTVRCREHNAAVGGVATSRHMAGRAMDFWVKGRSSNQVLAFVRTLNPSFAYAIDDRTVHMDF